MNFNPSWIVATATILIIGEAIVILALVKEGPPANAFPPKVAEAHVRVIASAPLVNVWHDDDRNVTCWEIQQGVSCLPDPPK